MEVYLPDENRLISSKKTPVVVILRTEELKTINTFDNPNDQVCHGAGPCSDIEIAKHIASAREAQIRAESAEALQRLLNRALSKPQGAQSLVVMDVKIGGTRDGLGSRCLTYGELAQIYKQLLLEYEPKQK